MEIDCECCAYGECESDCECECHGDVYIDRDEGYTAVMGDLDHLDDSDDE